MAEVPPETKKVIEGRFEKVYYNDCEAVCPLGIQTTLQEADTICDLLKEILNLDNIDPGLGDDLNYPKHRLMGKRVRITVEVFDD